MSARKKRRFGQIDQLKSGRFRARYTGPDGLIHKADRTFEANEDATSWLRKEEILIELDNWSPPASRRPEHKTKTVGQWLKEWLEYRSRGADALRPSTLDDYERVLNNRILKVEGEAKFLRDVRLSAVSKKHVSDWWDVISRDFDTPTRNYNAYKRLRTAMEGALDRQLILVNPCTVRRAAVRPVPKRKELPETQVLHDIIEELDHSKPRVDGRNKLAAILMLFHGLRINEVLGGNVRHLVKVGDGWEYWVRKNAYRNKDGGMLITDTPKSSAGWREVPIFPIFNDDVKWHLKHFGGDPDALLFPSPTGKVIVETSFRSILDRAKTRAGYEDLVLTPHYGRVWLITTLSEAGMPIPEIGRILGQVDLRTITEVYMRSSSQHRDAVLGSVNALLEKK